MLAAQKLGGQILPWSNQWRNILSFSDPGICGARLPPCHLWYVQSWGVVERYFTWVEELGLRRGGLHDPLCANVPSPSFLFRLPGGCWMMKWLSASPCPVNPACSTTTAPHRQVSRSPIPLTIASFPFALTTRSHRGWYENSQSLLQGRKSQVSMTQWQRMREMSWQALWRCDTWLLLSQIWFSPREVHVALRSPHSLSRLICHSSYPNLSASQVFNHMVGV